MQRVQLVVRPLRARRAADVPVRAVVGDDHPVLLQRLEHDPRLAREAGDRVALLQAEAHPHRRQVGIGLVAREVARRPDVGAAGVLDGEAQRVVDPAAARRPRSARARAGSAGRRRPRTSSRPAAACSSGGRRSRPSRPSSRRPRSGRARTARRACSVSRSTISAWRSPSDARPPSIATFPGSGTGPCPTRPRTRRRRASCACVLADDRDRDPDRAAVPEPRAEVRVHVVVGADRRDDRGPSWARPAACRRAGSRRSSAGKTGQAGACGSLAACGDRDAEREHAEDEERRFSSQKRRCRCDRSLVLRKRDERVERPDLVDERRQPVGDRRRRGSRARSPRSARPSARG